MHFEFSPDDALFRLAIVLVAGIVGGELFGMIRLLREQLYHARSAAYAYDVLHADDAQDINYFLDEAVEHYDGRRRNNESVPDSMARR